MKQWKCDKCGKISAEELPFFRWGCEQLSGEADLCPDCVTKLVTIFHEYTHPVKEKKSKTLFGRKK